ncbi:MAG: hypothetical protein K0Q50_170 [Vampirovibrio sp.]|nr:hypothetical protein [Vampirovibrio sp.]
MRNGNFQHGNTLSEYGILFALLVAASIGALSLVGGNISSLLSSLQVHTPTTSSPAVPWTNAQPQKILATGTTQPASDAGIQPINQNASNPTASALFTGNSSSGTNATSVDGNKQIGLDTVHSTWAYAQRLSQLADSTDDSRLKNYFSVLANDAYWLSGAQANYEYHAQGVDSLKTLGSVLDNGEINMDTTLATIQGWSNTLKMDFDRLQEDESIPISIKQEALMLAQRVMEKNEDRYAPHYLANAPATRLNTTDTFEQLKTIAKQTLAASQADFTPGVKTSIANATALDDAEQAP